MTKQLTRQEVESVMERMQEKDECRDPKFCAVCKRRRNTPIYIGNVLEKMKEKDNLYDYNDNDRQNMDELIGLWESLGFSKSLQEIIEESGWKKVRIPPEEWDEEQGGCSCHINPPCYFCEYSTYEEVLTSPEANALFSFLQEIV